MCTCGLLGCISGIRDASAEDLSSLIASGRRQFQGAFCGSSAWPRMHPGLQRPPGRSSLGPGGHSDGPN
eukprot:6926079-Pyramimonas_sp.AAC.1